MACIENLVWVQVLFWPGVALTTYLVAQHNGYGLKDAVLAALGLKTFKTTKAINLALFGTLFGTLGLAVLLLQVCPV